MKKQYSKPTIILSDLQCAQLISASLSNGGQDNGEGTTDANTRRGNWGNLWEE